MESKEPWTAYVVSRLHRYGISQRRLAQECNYSPSYMSELLNCRKKFRSKESHDATMNHILGTLEGMIDGLAI